MTHTEKVGDKDYYFFSLSPKTVFFDVKKCATCRDRVLFDIKIYQKTVFFDVKETAKIIVVALFDINRFLVYFDVKKTLRQGEETTVI